MQKNKFLQVLLLIGVATVAAFGLASVFSLFTDYVRGFLLGMGSVLIVFGVVGMVINKLIVKWVNKPE